MLVGQFSSQLRRNVKNNLSFTKWLWFLEAFGISAVLLCHTQMDSIYQHNQQGTF